MKRNPLTAAIVQSLAPHEWEPPKPEPWWSRPPAIYSEQICAADPPPVHNWKLDELVRTAVDLGAAEGDSTVLWRRDMYGRVDWFDEESDRWRWLRVCFR